MWWWVLVVGVEGKDHNRSIIIIQALKYNILHMEPNMTDEISPKFYSNSVYSPSLPSDRPVSGFPVAVMASLYFLRAERGCATKH